MKLKFIPIDYDYFDWQGRNYARLIGRDENGKRVCVVDSCDVYFWAVLKDGLSKDKINKLMDKIGKIKLDTKGRKTKVEKVEIHEKNFLGRKVNALKVFATNYKDLHDIADEMGFDEIEKRRGYDLGFITHYIIEKQITPLSWYEISGESVSDLDFGGISKINVDLCLKLESAKKIEEKTFNPRVLAFDIETDEIDIGKGEILMISLVSDKVKKIITWKKTNEKYDTEISSKHLGISVSKTPNQKTPGVFDYVEYVKDESELLEKFVEEVNKISPDFLTGYFSDGFDLPYLKARAEKYNIKLSLGLDDSQVRFHRGIRTTAEIKGIVHVDLIRFIETAYSQYMQSETLSLNEVASEFLNDTKKVFEIKHSSKMHEDEWEKYFEYNLQDSVLTYNLFEKFWPDMLEFSRVMQEPIYDVSRNGMAKNVESYILHNLNKFNEIPEKRPNYDEIGTRKTREKYEGAFVFQPQPGLYENVCFFDFTSSYGSVIVTYNLSKSTYLEKQEKNSYNIEVGDKKVYFEKKPGFFPEMLKDIIEKRKQFKRELKEKPDAIKKARSNAFKLLANASYGYQGFFGARYYCEEAAAATAAFARKAIKDSIDEINKQGFKVIYSDTDSISFLFDGKTKKQVLDFLKKLNDELPGIMELELEDFYKRGIWVTKRTGEFGAKKKYALISEDGKLKIRGFETVRRNWCQLARQLQNNVLRMILQDGNEKKALEYVKDTIKQLKERKIDRKQILIRTQLSKPISEYKAISPHVIAAQKMKERKLPVSPETLIEYFLAETRDKKKLIREKVKLPDEKGEYNIEYYLNHQILPAVENIFQVFNVNIKEVIAGKKQMKLF